MAKETCKTESVPVAMDELMKESVVFEGEEVSGTVAIAKYLRKVMLSSKEPTNLRLQAVKMILELKEQKKTSMWD